MDTIINVGYGGDKQYNNHKARNTFRVIVSIIFNGLSLLLVASVSHNSIMGMPCNDSIKWASFLMMVIYPIACGLLGILVNVFVIGNLTLVAIEINMNYTLMIFANMTANVFAIVAIVLYYSH